MERVTHLLLVRHAETGMAGRFCGHSDPGLNERGRQQLAGLLNMLSEHAIRRIYTSDLVRAQQTGETIAEHFGAELHVRPALREIYFGQWEGLTWNEIEARDPAQAKRWAEEYPNSTAPGGESFQEFEARVRGELTFLVQEATNFPIAAVAHAGFIRVALANGWKVSEEEARSRTKNYGTFVALDANHIDRAWIENSDSRSAGADGTLHELQGAQK
ncbi:MAG: histidine phosphatase family protein [Candidatus Sulfotelmatobacter sp.]